MRLTIVVLVSLGLLVPLPGQTQSAPSSFPDRPIRIIVPFAPGGATDIVARAMARELASGMNQSVIIDNRGGAGGAVGHEIAVRATPDGYTLALVSGSYATSAALKEPPYDPVNSITPVILLAEALFVIAVNPNFQAKSVADLIAISKAKSSSVSYGTTGVGGITHLAMELFDLMAGTRMTMIPYKGTAPAMADVISGQIPMMVGTAPGVLPHMKSGRVRALAVTSAKRSGAIPGVAAVAETVPNYEAVSWFAIWAPKGVPRARVSRLNEELNRILSKPDVRALFLAEALEMRGGSPQVLGDFIPREIAKWKKVTNSPHVMVR